MFVVVDGVLAPMGDTGHCDGEGNQRWQDWNSDVRPGNDNHYYLKLSFEFSVETEGYDDQSPATNFRSLGIDFEEIDYYVIPSDETDNRAIFRTLGYNGGTAFRRFFRRHAVPAQRNPMFATDSMTPGPFSVDRMEGVGEA